jgi:threonine dehydrogenase-like Zn-dependent dehydrogenase
MRALIYDGELRLERDVPDPVPSDGDVLLKIRRAGICSTDLHLMAGYKDFSGILGHEFVAEVIQGPQHLLGKRVVGEISVTDEDCEYCRRGIPSQCLHRDTIGIMRYPGAFADYLQLPTRNLHLVPDGISDDEAIFVEPIAAALQVTEAVHISPRDRIIVLGVGRLGMLVAQVLKLTGADVIGVVRRKEQADLLHRWHIDAVESDELQSRSAQVVVDVTGSSEGFAQSLDLVKPRGTIVIKSTYMDPPQADLTRVMVDETRIVGSRCGPFDAALRLLESGVIDTRSLIDARYDLDQAVEAMNHAVQKGVLKVLLDF